MWSRRRQARLSNKNNHGTSTKDLLHKLNNIATILVLTDPQKLRIAKNEQNETTAPCADAATFLKLNEKRLGRDLELYAFMSKLESVDYIMVQFLEEVVLPLKDPSPKAFTAGIAQLRKHKMENREVGWTELLDSLAS